MVEGTVSGRHSQDIEIEMERFEGLRTEQLKVRLMCNLKFLVVQAMLLPAHVHLTLLHARPQHADTCIDACVRVRALLLSWSMLSARSHASRDSCVSGWWRPAPDRARARRFCRHGGVNRSRDRELRIRGGAGAGV